MIEVDRERAGDIDRRRIVGAVRSAAQAAAIAKHDGKNLVRAHAEAQALEQALLDVVREYLERP